MSRLYAIAMILALFSCKLDPGESQLTEEYPDQAMTTVHGMPVTIAQKQQVLIALNGGSPGSNSGTINPDGTSIPGQPDTLIAGNNPAGGLGSNGGVDPFGANAYDDSYGNDDIQGPNGGYQPDPYNGFALQGNDTPYMQSCRTSGVPIPPAWGDPKWVSQGVLPESRIFALNNQLRTELYVYRSTNPAGTCAALPRTMPTTGEIRALGIICQGANGSACFWDNVVPGTERKISDPTRIRPELIGDGSNLVENCTECHRGGNVFIVHKGTSLEQIPDRDTTQPYEPISGQPTWGNNIAAGNIARECASQCHDGSTTGVLGKLDPAYCFAVILPSVTGIFFSNGNWNTVTPTMPPPNDSDPADFVADIAQIKRECAKFWNPKDGAYPWQ